MTNSKRLARMMRMKPMSARDSVIRWVEFLAEFKALPELQSTANELNFIEYHLIDIAFITVLVVLAFIFALYKLITILIRLCFRKSIKSKKE